MQRHVSLCYSCPSFPSFRTLVSHRHLAVVAVLHVGCAEEHYSVHHRVLLVSVCAGVRGQGARTSSNVDLQNVGHVCVASAGGTVRKPCARFVRGWCLDGNLLSLWVSEPCACPSQGARPKRIWGSPSGEVRMLQPKSLIAGTKQ